MNRPVALCCLLLAAAASQADGQKLPLWQLDGEKNRVYLLGSVHLLRESDYPLPAAIDAAYEEAEALVMELDLDDLDPAAAAALTRELGRIAGDGSLEDLLGPSGFERAEALAATANVSLQALSRTEPWLAALSIEQLVLSRLGFDVGLGVESHLVSRAKIDRKEITGLETLDEQLGLLDALSIDAQRKLLLSTLEVSVELGDVMDEMIRAWRVGDLPALERALLADMLEQPELYAAVIETRNRRFTEQIVRLLDDSDDYLVVMGALHLIGEEGVPQLLAREGHRAQQLLQSAAR